MVVTCANCGKLMAAEDSRCPNCGATREPTAQPVSSAWPGSSPTRSQGSSLAQFMGCVTGGVLVFVVLIVLGQIIFVVGASARGSTTISIVATALIAVLLIPVLFPYGRRFSTFVRWMLGSACVLLLVGLGATAACFAMFRYP